MDILPKTTDRLEGNEGQDFARSTLVQVAVDDVNWTVLHRNPATAEYWKEFYPQSQLIEIMDKVSHLIV